MRWMQKRLPVAICAMVALCADVLWPSLASAYVDPGTGTAVFGAFGYLIAMGGAVLAFFLRPIRNLFKSIFWMRRKNKSEAPPQEGEIDQSDES